MKQSQESSRAKVNPGSKVFVGIMIFFWYMNLFLLLMGMSISTEEGILSTLYLMIVPFPVAVWMTVLRIQYRVKNHLKPHPVRFMKKVLLLTRDFLLPTVYQCRPAEDPGTGAAAKAADFLQEYEKFYEGETLGDHVTQMYRHQLQMHRERLRELGAEMRADWKRLKFKREDPVAVSAFSDGKLRRTLAEEHVKGYRRYMLGGREIYISKGILGAEYDLIGAWNGGTDGKNAQNFRCPGCGGVSSGKELAKGCPFCGNAFLMEELQDRVCNYTLFKDPYFDRKLAGLKINGHLNRISFGFALLMLATYIQMLLEIFVRDHASLTGLPIGILLFSSSTVMAFLLTLAAAYAVTIPLRMIANAVYREAQKRRSEDLQVMESNREKASLIRKTDPGFSLHSFLSNVRNKAASVHYASSAKQAEVFSTADLGEVIPGYRDVLDCFFGPVRLEEYTVSGDLRQARVSMKLKLLRLQGQKAVLTGEELKLRLIRKTEPPTRNPFGIYSVRCSTCGQFLDLTRGNTCAFCGNQWDLRQYDWCIAEYHVQAEKK